MNGESKLPNFDKPKTIDNVLSRIAVSQPDAPALILSDGEVLTYGALATEAARLRKRLLTHGIRATDRVAVMTPRGTDAVAAFFAVMSCATLVPMESGIGATEFEDLMSRMAIGFLVTTADCPPAIVDAVGKRQVTIIRADPSDWEQPVKFDSPAFDPATFQPSPDIGPDSIALMLKTSGTTSRAKIVPVTHSAFLHASEKNSKYFNLSTQDRCLNLMPLYHSHGINIGMMTTFQSGGSIIMPSRLSVRHLLDLIENQSPSWVTGAASFYRMILAHAKDENRRVHAPALRFLRASSESISPADAAAIGRLLRVPVIIGYGMTETIGQIAAKPLVNGESCIGSIGRPVTAEFAVLDETGDVHPKGEGEVLLRGDSVFGGYLDDPEATAAAFHEGWFRTGDFGRVENDGSLTLIGRLKEIISCGGEKIAPAEIEAVIAMHPEVAEAVVFGIPHPTLGEVGAAALVRMPGSTVTEDDVFDFLGERLTLGKVPRRLIFVAAIPRGPSGKIQRVNLPALLCEHDPAPRMQETEAGTLPTQTETRLLRLWREVLPAGEIHRDDDFFMLGGDSLAATQLVLAVNERFRIDMRLEEVFDAARTIAKMAARIDVLVKDGPIGGNIDLPLAAIDEEIAKIGYVASNNANPRSQTDDSVSDQDSLFVFEKETGLRRIRPGSVIGQVRANSHGFRSPEIPLKKSFSTIRFAFLSDSFTFGSWNMGEEETWPFQMVEQVKSNHPGLSCDYVNASMPGTGIRHIELLYEYSIAAFRPDIVIIMPGTSANSAAFARRKIGYSGVHYKSKKWCQGSRLLEWIEKNLVVVCRQVRALSNWGKLTFQSSDLRELSREFETQLEALVTECQKNGSIVILLTRVSRIRRDQSKLHQIWVAGSRLLYQPYMSISGLLDSADEFNRVYRDVASRCGALIADLVGVVPANSEFFRDSSHLTARANRVIGKKVSRVLDQSHEFASLRERMERLSR